MDHDELEKEFKELIDSLYQSVGKKLADKSINKDDAQELIRMIDERIDMTAGDSWTSSSLSC